MQVSIGDVVTNVNTLDLYWIYKSLSPCLPFDVKSVSYLIRFRWFLLQYIIVQPFESCLAIHSFYDLIERWLSIYTVFCFLFDLRLSFSDFCVVFSTTTRMTLLRSLVTGSSPLGDSPVVFGFQYPGVSSFFIFFTDFPRCNLYLVPTPPPVPLPTFFSPSVLPRLPWRITFLIPRVLKGKFIKPNDVTFVVKGRPRS